MAHIVKVQRANGGCAYEVHWRDHGKKRQITCKTLPKAEREKVRIEDELAGGRSTAHRTERRTVAEVVEASIAASAPSLKPKSTDGARSVARKHIVPVFGRRRVISLRPQDVERWVQKLSKTLSPGTIRNIYNVLNKAMKYALRHEWIANNPCTGVELPKSTSEIQDDRCFLTPAQVSAVADALAQKQPWHGLVVRMSAYTGLRAGEMAALRIRDINLLHRVVEVRRTVARRTGQGWVTTAPKSKRSARDVPLTRSLAAELTTYIESHPDKTNPDAPLWPGSRNTGKGGELDWSRRFDIGNLVKRYFKPLVRSGALAPAGISTATRWHDLRHTYASIMAAAGRDVRLVSQWMGHSSISVTEKTYVHLFRVDHTDEMDAVEAFLAGSGATLGHVAPVAQIFGVVGGS
ncbi:MULTISPECIES: tyrosine-type recombinase/integrase [unclassified Streptomyces]|uniref:tyrosine-type recombinase/integrase n=1 Tax=unclassified Streptomyces TaxID=2593676 RepID=UPI0036E70B98